MTSRILLSVEIALLSLFLCSPSVGISQEKSPADAGRHTSSRRDKLPSMIGSLAIGPFVGAFYGAELELELDIGRAGRYLAVAFNTSGGANWEDNGLLNLGGTVGYRYFFPEGRWTLLTGLQVMHRTEYDWWGDYTYLVAHGVAKLGYHVNPPRGVGYGVDVGILLGYAKDQQTVDTGYEEDEGEDYSGFSGGLVIQGRLIF